MLIPVNGDMLIGLLEEVGRARALTDHETDLIEEIVAAEKGDEPFQWSEEHDRMLAMAANRKAICRLAHELGVSPGAAYMRYYRAKKRKTVKMRDARFSAKG